MLVYVTLDMGVLLAANCDVAEQNSETSLTNGQVITTAQSLTTNHTILSKAAHFDYGGTLLLILSMIGLVLALNLGGNDLPWSHPIIPVLFTLFVCGLTAFVIYEVNVASKPLVPMRLLTQGEIAPIFGAQFFKSCTSMAVRSFNDM